MAEMSWQIAIPFMLFALGGNWLDKQLDSEPVFTIVGLLLAVVSVSLIVRKLVDKHYPNTFKKDKE